MGRRFKVDRNSVQAHPNCYFALKVPSMHYGLLGRMPVMLWQDITETTQAAPKLVQWIDLDVRTNHYRTLGVDPSVSTLSLKRAFYRLAAQYHPDKNHGDSRATAEARMKELNAAYSVLRARESRAEYDASLGL